MARKKTRLAYITGTAARNATLRKRRLGLLKKVRELSILCDVPACAVIYAPNERQPEVWPSVEAARGLLCQFDAAYGAAKADNMMNPEKFLAMRLVKMRTQLGRVMAENADLNGELLLRRCLAGLPFSWLGWDELVLVDRAIYCRAEAVKARILQISRTVNDNPLYPPLPLLHPPPLLSPAVEEGFRIYGSLIAVDEIQNKIFSMAAVPPACRMPEVELKQGILIESELKSGELGELGLAIAARSEAAETQLHHLSKEYSGGGAFQPSTPLLFPPSLILSPVEVGVMETEDLPAGYGGAAWAAAECGPPEMGGFGVSLEQEQGTASEKYLATWEELESYFLMD
ncbi:Agamous-like MADS-box protein AGL80 [Platanthera guangdongensis]|uniref:Agamous-like MADS-box protein AGL80 n=1 Tax=Platanthera guangdongensis TaxID=2320717 RepID=A0ABR2MC43_9ASPA